MGKRIVVSVISILVVSPCLARIITVDDDGPADFSNIQAAINDANNGDEIIVGIGTYNENINFNGKNINSHSTKPMNPFVVANTVIEGLTLGGSVVSFSGAESNTCVLSGFTITGGSGTETPDHSYSYGGGIYGNGTLATIQFNVISENMALSLFYGAGFGGGIYNCDGIIQGNIISNNTASRDLESFENAGGGGLFGCDGIIQNNIISYNKIFGKVELADIGGGLGNCNGTIRNNTIFHNSAGSGGGLSNCTGTIINCIIWQNTANQGAQLYSSSTPSYSCIQNWPGGGTGNISADPYFAGDYHLGSQAGRWDPDAKVWVQDANTSPCIDAGDPNSDWTKELWPNGKRINMGAYGGTSEASMSISDAGNIANLDNDPCDIVDLNDLAVFAGKWCYEENLLAEDLDRNGRVDFRDYAFFGSEYFDTHPVEEPGETGISYTITPCEPGLSQAGTYELMDGTRFTVTVNGHFIHFEDMMVGNCCTPLSNLFLDMIIDGNLITIYEIEILPQFPCFCICDYPVEADAGPFESGTYTLEVYEDYGGFIGSTTFTIE
ncbi:MAG: hypothetical protein JW749_05035 [Sedimentisphaerales bacterium]|nr:hypothetical protein [Sedimentisphaerales bacterium]